MRNVFILFVFVFILSANIVFAEPSCLTKDGYFAAVSEKILDEAVDYSRQKDLKALRKLKEQNLLFSLKEGVEVYREDVTWDGKVEIRLPGQRQTLWTLMEAVDCE